MKILLNGNLVETSATTMAQLCEEQGYGDAKIATAQNGDFIAQNQRASTKLKAQDKIEIVAPRQGG